MLQANNFLELPAMKVSQPLGEFYAVVFKAKDLLLVSYSEPAKNNKELDAIDFTQRKENTSRLIEIGKYIDTVDSAFPNSIIVGANYNDKGEHITDNDVKWRIITGENGGYTLIVPKELKIASIIDGQHRLHGFEHSLDSDRKNMELLCSVYLDIPVPYHAYIFSTINFNQKKVDKSLAYSLFGFDIESSPVETWSPETLAIFLSRKLNSDEISPFYQRVKLGIQEDISYESKSTFEVFEDKWSISMATLVDGILGLITSNAKKDRYELMKYEINRGRNRNLLSSEGPPLRFLYIKGYDKALYEIILSFFLAVKDVFWENLDIKSYIRKTVGVQALFDVMKILSSELDRNNPGDYKYFKSVLSKASHIDFTKMEASGIGKTKIKNSILLSLNYTKIDDIDPKDREFYIDLLGSNVNI